MNIIICGAGEVGFSLAKYLASENMQVTVIDDSIDRLQKVSGSIDVRTLTGKTYNPNILLEANANDTDLLISVTEQDEVNILTCEVAKILFNVPNTIARIKEKELLDEKTWIQGIDLDIEEPDIIAVPHIPLFSLLIQVPTSKLPPIRQIQAQQS